MEATGSRHRRAFASEYNAEVLEFSQTGGTAIGSVARDLGLAEAVGRRWVNQAETDAGQRAGLTTTDREELTRLRKENRVLRQERDILKRATVFFARETQ